MINLYESHHYDISYRAILIDENIKLFTEKYALEVDSEVEFDIEKNYKSSINYFASSIISSIILNTKLQFKKENIITEEIEGKINLTLSNPLTLLGVKGYDAEPKISKCHIMIYIYTELEENETIKKCNEFLKKCYIYNTLKNAFEFEVKFIPII